jgi:hypothetical protein
VWQMVDLDTVREVADPSPRWIVVGMSDYDHLMASVYQFLSYRQ